MRSGNLPRKKRETENGERVGGKGRASRIAVVREMKNKKARDHGIVNVYKAHREARLKEWKRASKYVRGDEAGRKCSSTK